MRSKWLVVLSSVLMAGLILITSITQVGNANAMPSMGQIPGTEMSEPNRPTIKTGTFNELLTVDTRGGVIVPLANFNLKQAGADWGYYGVSMDFKNITGMPYGYYKLNVINTDINSEDLVAWSGAEFTPKPNRYYMVSALINSTYTRKPPVGEPGTEINIGTYTYGVPSSDPTQSDAQLGNWNGTPENTNGWVRWEWVYPSSLLGKHSQAWFRFFAPRTADFRIADFTIVELPARTITPWAKGQGVTFRGGPGDLPIHITSVTTSTGGITVKTTGSSYYFDLNASNIVATQLIEKKPSGGILSFFTATDRADGSETNHQRGCPGERQTHLWRTS